MNFAAKLYLLYRDTDIDIAAFAGDSRTARYGVDFSRNLASHIEVHAEYAFLTRIRQNYLDGSGTVSMRERSVSQYLLGLRYLTENDITAIVEYYHNGAGFSGTELDRFYRRVDDALASESDHALDTARALSKKGYASAQAGSNYLYLKVNQKEPFDILYFTPGLIAIVNLDDQSFSVSPELAYTVLPTGSSGCAAPGSWAVIFPSSPRSKTKAKLNCACGITSDTAYGISGN